MQVRATLSNRWILAVVAASARHPLWVVVIAAICAAASIIFSARHFDVSTDTASLLSSALPWRQREARFDALFPQRVNLIVVVIDGATPEIAEFAAGSLTERLNRRTDLLRNIRRPDGGLFFDRNGMLFLAPEEVQRATGQLIAAQPLLGTLALDPSARGLFRALSLATEGVRRGETAPEPLARPLSALAESVEGVLAGRSTPFSLRALLSGDQAVSSRELRRFILVQPALDFSALQPGSAATSAIRDAARELGLDSSRGVRVRLTGEVPLGDEEFATLAQGAALDATLTLLSVIVLLWLAVRSATIVLALLLSLCAGLAVTAAFGLLVFGAFNLISIAFAVLFIGLGIDFGIQFSVSYRAHLYSDHDIDVALTGAARQVGQPLALAAASTALGFYAFLPTEYRGISERGAIAGTGMLIAFVATITLLPALLRLFNVHARARPMGYPTLGRIDRFLLKRRRTLLIVIAAVTVVSAGAAPAVRFDFNPLHLRSPKTESVATLLDLMRDPDTNPYAANALAPSLAQAQTLARRFDRLPQVAQTLTLASFVPEDQDRKLALISDAALLLDATLNPAKVSAAPDDQALVESLRESAKDMAWLASTGGAVSALAARLQRALTALADAQPAQRARLDATIGASIRITLDQIRGALSAAPVTVETLPRDLVQDWIAQDGSARVEVRPRGDANDNETMRAFVAAVQSVAPDATGAPVSIQESSRTIIAAFLIAGVWAWPAITLLLILVLRNVRHVLLTLAPLVLAGLATLALCAALDIRLNFENIIALPLLLGVGVAFSIYFVVAWRGGTAGLLASSLARAIIFSALTTSAAFGSLWLSQHPGTASMGELLALSLACTLVCTLFVLPVLLGPPAPSRTGQL